MTSGSPTEYEQLSPQDAARVDSICDGFEQAWKQAAAGGDTPRIKGFVEGWEDPQRTILIRELIALDQACRRRYQVPIPAEEYQELGGASVSGDTYVGGQGSGSESWPDLPGLKLIEVLGSGGMGVVFKARQAALDRYVAVKLLRDAYVSGSAQRERFVQEARAVARLQHPNLVQVYEFGDVSGAGGTTSQPYLVLEYVAGGSLANVVRGLPQPPLEAARLVAILAEAIHHAHQQGIIHRDLKPANVLLSAEREVQSAEPGAFALRASRSALHVPKVTDFGLAKFLTGSDLTRTGDVLGTPSYMAPEQTDGKFGEVTAAVDVYGLGSILYEALTGRPPFQAENPVATLAQVQQDDPVPPRRLQPTVPGDLETICLKCLRKEASRRYGSAQELADDLRRFQSGEPILARPVGTGERIARWCRRKPVIASLAASLAVAFIGGFSGIFWQWQRAEQNADAANKSASELKKERDKVVGEWERAERNLDRARKLVERLTNLGHQLTEKPGLDATGRKLLNEALVFHQEVLEEKGSDPAVRLEAARAFGRVGDIHHTLRQYDNAIAAYQQQITLMTGLLDEFPGNVDHRYALAYAHRCVAHSFRDAGRHAEATKSYDAAIALERALHEEFPKSGNIRIALANSLLNSVRSLNWSTQVKEIEGRQLQAAALQQEAVEVSQTNKFFQQELALGLVNVGGIHAKYGRVEQAEDAYRRALEIRQRLHNEGSDRDSERYLAGAYGSLAGLLTAKQPVEAEQLCRSGVELLDNLCKDFPARPIYRMELADMQVQLGDLLTKPEQLEELKKLIGQALGHYEKLAVDFPTEPRHVRKQAGAAYVLGARCKDHKDYAAALVAFQRMRAANDRLIADFGADPIDRHNRAWDSNLLSGVAELAGNSDQACDFLRQCVDQFRKLASEFPREPVYRTRLVGRADALVQLLRKAGKTQEALAANRDVIADWRSLVDTSKGDPAHQRGLVNSVLLHVVLCQAQNRSDETFTTLREALTLMPQEARIQNSLAWFLATCPASYLRDPAEAVRLAQKAVDAAPKASNYWNTLGVAQYRNGEWKAALVSLQKALDLRKQGDGFDWFFLAMAHARLGTRDQARAYFDRAVQWMEKNSPHDAELLRFRAEAQTLLP